ncbi:MAG TPA: M28 family peptidase [Gemmataceae bacterium]|nr:M28 family peptidase [Gemmataceae bacterium]
MSMKYRRLVLIALVLGLGAVFGQGFAQDVKKEDPSLARMRKDITFLASDECEGRGVGTLGLDLAAQYIAVQFSHAGLKPGGVNGTFFQPFPFCTNAQLDGKSSMSIITKGTTQALEQGKDFDVLGTSSSANLTAPVVFVGYGVTAKGIDYDDYAGQDVKGKIVIALRRLPRWKDAKRPFDGTHKDELAALESKQYRAQAAKAAAVILVNDATDADKDAFIPFATTSRGIITVNIPFVQMKRAILDELLKSATGKSLAETEKAIDDNLKPQSATIKETQITLNVKVKRQETMVKNVIGVLEGSGPLANETIVVGAHYDHLGYGGFGSLGGKNAKDKIHHGADDNGSGTTSVMELARRFGAMKDRQGRRMVFMTFTAEERGLIGSRHYARVEPLFSLKNTAAMFNLDMVGRLKDTGLPDGAKPKLLALGMDSGKGFEDLVKKHNPGFDVVKDKSVFGASDHFSFYQQRIPVIFFWTGTHPDYHRPTDTSDKINVAGMKRIADYAEKIIDDLRTMPKRPEYVENKTPFVGGAPKGPRMGILPDYQFGGKGVKIDGVSVKGPAEEAGLKKGDVILQIAGKMVPDVNAYMTLMASQKSGTPIEITILRDTKELKLKVTPK